MECPECGSSKSHILQTRTTRKGIRRRRECRSCKKRYTTYETKEKYQ